MPNFMIRQNSNKPVKEEKPSKKNYDDMTKAQYTEKPQTKGRPKASNKVDIFAEYESQSEQEEPSRAAAIEERKKRWQAPEKK